MIPPSLWITSFNPLNFHANFRSNLCTHSRTPTLDGQLSAMCHARRLHVRLLAVRTVALGFSHEFSASTTALDEQVVQIIAAVLPFLLRALTLIIIIAAVVGLFVVTIFRHLCRKLL